VGVVRRSQRIVNPALIKGITGQDAGSASGRAPKSIDVVADRTGCLAARGATLLFCVAEFISEITLVQISF
jgi:hypothetical protein